MLPDTDTLILLFFAIEGLICTVLQSKFVLYFQLYIEYSCFYTIKRQYNFFARLHTSSDKYILRY